MQNQTQDQFSVVHGQSEVKPRLKWTSELHQKFVEAVNQLGGAEKATPKTVMRVMGVPGLTLYHLKSHLQKYRLGKNQNRIETRIENDKKDSQVSDRQSTENRDRQINDSDKGWRKTDINDLQIAKALHLQMEVQKKLHDQIEVQRHLQLRIEAQGKYLQSVLKKAQEALAGYNSPAAGLEAAKEELSELLSLVDSECPNSSISGSIEFSDKNTTNQLINLMRPQTNDSSQESCLTSFEFSEKKDGRTPILQTDSEETNESNKDITLPLMDINPISGEKFREKRIRKIETEKISEENISTRISFQRDDDNRSPKFRLSQELDLNV